MSFFAYEYDPAAKFDMYTPMHVLMLVLFVAFAVVFLMSMKKMYNSPREKLYRYSFATFLLVVLITLIIVEYAGGHYYLPFHLCSISFILTIVLLYTNNEKIWFFVFFTGIIGGFVSFAIPDLYHAGYNRFRFYEFIIAHGSIILVPIYYLTMYKYKVTTKITFGVIALTNILGFAMIPVNYVLDKYFAITDNFMFVMGPPEDVESIFFPYPFHLINFELILLITFFGIYYVAKYYQEKDKESIINEPIKE